MNPVLGFTDANLFLVCYGKYNLASFKGECEFTYDFILYSSILSQYYISCTESYIFFLQDHCKISFNKCRMKHTKFVLFPQNILVK